MVKWTSSSCSQNVLADGTDYIAKAQEPPQILSYHINRTKAQGLPIYEMTKAGNKRLTRIRRIVGDIKTLKRDIQTELQVPDEHIEINHLNQTIVVKVQFNRGYTNMTWKLTEFRVLGTRENGCGKVLPKIAILNCERSRSRLKPRDNSQNVH